MAVRAVEAALIGWELPPLPIAFAELPVELDEIGAWCLRCGESVSAAEVTPRGCASCRGQRLPWKRFVRVAEYSASLATRINQVKHLRWSAMAEALGARLATQCRVGLASPPDLVVSIPMPWLRRWWRGIDHGAWLAGGVARSLGVPAISVGAQRSGPPQASRSRSERLRSRHRFAIAKGERRLVGRRVLLVDDVRTTGATLRQFARLLRDAGAAEVAVGVVAVVPNPRRRVGISRKDAGESEAG
ncbi:MAG: ComF family protein [Phycisphaerae bacterium]|nr:ComF family protein [Phycisphaerae bacterium]